jgi:hypothetical protein
VLPHQIRWDEDVFFALFKVLILFAKEAEAFWGDFEKSVDCDGITGEFKRFAFAWLATVSIVIARAVSADPSLSLAAIAVSIAVPVSIPVSIVVAVAGVGGLLAAGVR